MNVRGAAVQSGLAALGLVVAYTTWQREPERAPGEVVVVDVNKSDVQKVRYRRRQRQDRRARAAQGEAAKSRACGSSCRPTPKPKKPAREVPGNEGAERLWDKFAPLRATRALGTLQPDKLKELGLDAPKKHLEVTARGVKHTFDVGSSPFGVSDPYVKDEQRRARLRARRRRRQRSRVGGHAARRSPAARVQAGRLRQRHDLGRRQVAHAAGAAVGERVRGQAGERQDRQARRAWPRTGTTRSGA